MILTRYEAVTAMTKMIRLLPDHRMQRHVVGRADPTEVITYFVELRGIRGWLQPDGEDYERHHEAGIFQIEVIDTMMTYTIGINFAPLEQETREVIVLASVDTMNNWWATEQSATELDTVVRRFLTEDDGATYLAAISGRRYVKRR